jgi:hypothetical protein
MATKFSQIYKQELKSKGILSSLGSAALKQRKERMDIRNVLFGGSGIVSATGQKIFGKGFSALGGAPKLSSDSPQQSAAVNALGISMERQESLLKVVAKNTMNMNSMARDMNITRQNIASMTKKMTGKSSRGADALWMGADKRNSLLSDKKKSPTNANKTTQESSGGGILSSIGAGIGGIFSGIGSVISGGAGLVGGIIGGLLGVVGKVGGGILGVIGTVMSGVPGGFILAAIALAGVAYLIKQVSENVDFSTLGDEIKNKFYSIIGYDPNSEDSFLKQITKKLDEVFETTKFSDSLKWITNKFGPTLDNLGKSIATITDVTTVYVKAAYQTLADSVSNTGKIFGFLINELFQANKGKIFAAIAGGLAIGIGGRTGAGALVSLGAAGLAGLFGYATGEPSRDELPGLISEKEKEIKDFEKERSVSLQGALEQRAKGGLFEQNLSSNQKSILQMYDNLQNLKSISQRKNKEWEELINPQIGNKFNKYIEEGKASLPGGQYGGGYSPMSPANKNTPTKIDAGALSRYKFSNLSEEQKQAFLTAQANAEGVNKTGTIPNRLNNPGAMVWNPEWQKQFGAEAGDTVNGRTFAKFPTMAQGQAAQRWLWENGKYYKDATLLEGLKKWVDPGSAGNSIEAFENYGTNLENAIKRAKGIEIASLSTQMNDGVRSLAMNNGSSGSTVINNNNTTNTSSGGTVVAASWNKDAAELFVTNAYA